MVQRCDSTLPWPPLRVISGGPADFDELQRTITRLDQQNIELAWILGEREHELKAARAANPESEPCTGGASAGPAKITLVFPLPRGKHARWNGPQEGSVRPPVGGKEGGVDEHRSVSQFGG